MKNLKNIVLFTIISLLLFCGCSQENKSASDTVNPQDGKSVSEQQETIVDSEKAAENVTDKMSLLEAVGEGHVYLTFPNFDELSVGEIRDGQSNKSVLFDAQGMVHHLFEDGSRVVSGYYNGMCLLSNGMMATEVWGDRIFEKCGIGRDERGDGGKTLEIRGKRRLPARDRGANYQQS